MTIQDFMKLNNAKLPPELAALYNRDTDVWSQQACYGYCIYAMEDAGYTREQIAEVLHFLHDVMDVVTVDQAAEKYVKW